MPSSLVSGIGKKSFCSLWSQAEVGCQANQQLSAMKKPLLVATPIVTGNRNPGIAGNPSPAKEG